PGKKPQQVNVGDQLKKTLEKNKKLGWTFVSEDEAKKGVKSGKYYASIHIPKDFSEDMVSVVNDNVTKPTIDYSVNEKINAIAPKMTESGATTIVNQISSEFVGTVSKAVLEEFNKAGIDLENELPTIRRLKTKVFQVQDALPELKKMGAEAVKIEAKLPELKAKANQVVELNEKIPELNKATENVLLVEQQLPKIDQLGQDILVLQKKIPEIKQIAESVKEVDENFGTIKKTVNDAVNESGKALDVIDTAMAAIPTVEKIAQNGSGYVDKVSDFADEINKSFDTLAPAIKQNLTLMKQMADNIYQVTEAIKNGSITPEQAITELKKMEQDIDSLQQMITKQTATLESLNETLPNKPFTDLIANLKTINSQLGAQKETITKVLTELENGAQPSEELLNQLNEQAKKVSAKLDQILANYDSEIVPAIKVGLNQIQGDLKDSQKLLETLQAKIPEITQVLKDSRETLQTGQTYLKEFQERLPEIQKTLDEATKVINTKLDTIIAGINEAANFYQNDYPNVKANIKKAANFIRDDLPGLEKEINQASNLIQEKMPEFEKAIKIAADLSREELPEFEKAINNAANKITDFDKNYDLQSIIKMLRNDADKDSSFIANPVKLKETSYYPIPNYGSASSPFYTALCLWVGALLLISLLRVDVEVPAGIFSHYHRYFGRLLTFLSIGLMQALIVTLGNIFLLGVSIAEPLLHVLFSMFISVVFMTIVYTLVSLFNNVGKGIAIILLVLQISGAGGNFPIQVSPPFFQAIYPFLPFTYAVSLIRESVGGLYMPTVWIDMSVLAGFAILFITLGILLKKPLDKVVPKLSEKAKRSKLIH
ncbi:YhgE/Pip domain-containing protein, partial [Listeria monocytogenes]|nr:YhgE/Pip domain-containing protein [Listeria monocytogenes]